MNTKNYIVTLGKWTYVSLETLAEPETELPELRFVGNPS